MSELCDYGRVYVNDKGTEVILDCGEDITSGSVFKIYYRKPDGTTGSWTAAAYNNNYVRYINSTEWEVAGVWKFQSYVEYNTGYHFYGRTYEEEIFPLYG